MKQSKRIVAIHLLNDFSGSPFVLRQALEALTPNYAVTLFTATPSGRGFLTDIPKVEQRSIFYRWHPNRWATLFFYLLSQALLFFKLLRYVRSNDMVYVNSLLPFGAALAAKLRGCKVVYHIHEVSIKPVLLKRFLTSIANTTATKGIFVSHDLLARTPFGKAATVVYNSLPPTFIQAAEASPAKKEGPFTVLMLCSLKRYKGVMEFLACANQLPEVQFVLVLNATDTEIRYFFGTTAIPPNLSLHPAQQNVHPFYQGADVVVNLSLPHQWVETFGMTILEAMYYKRPVIIPNVGGITELVKHGQEGFRVNPANTSEVCNFLMLLKTSNEVYAHLAQMAYQKAQAFTPTAFAAAVNSIMNQLHNPAKPSAQQSAAVNYMEKFS